MLLIEQARDSPPMTLYATCPSYRCYIFNLLVTFSFSFIGGFIFYICHFINTSFYTSIKPQMCHPDAHVTNPGSLMALSRLEHALCPGRSALTHLTRWQHYLALLLTGHQHISAQAVVQIRPKEGISTGSLTEHKKGGRDGKALRIQPKYM